MLLVNEHPDPTNQNAGDINQSRLLNALVGAGLTRPELFVCLRSNRSLPWAGSGARTAETRQAK